MSGAGEGTAGRRRLIVPMLPRSPDEPHRVATPLELFFDLVFVVAVAQVSSGLHHGIADDHVLDALVGYASVFFAIWWAWMNFTWFASAYDTDDILYRVVVFVQLTGALILAAGVPSALDSGDFRVVTFGFVVMRLALVAQWLRAARGDPQHRVTALRYVVGIVLCQIGWIGLLFVSAEWRLLVFAALAAAELAIPVWAEGASITPWHPEHINERFGLFTIIVLGESILAASGALQAAVAASGFDLNILAIIVGGLLIIFAMWWLYFDQPENKLRSTRIVFLWSYTHAFIFAAAAAVGAGLAVAVDYATDHAVIGSIGANAAVAVPVAVFLLSLWMLQSPPRNRLLPIGAIAVLATIVSGQAVLLTGVVMVGIVGLYVLSQHRTPTAARPHAESSTAD